MVVHISSRSGLGLRWFPEGERHILDDTGFHRSRCCDSPVRASKRGRRRNDCDHRDGRDPQRLDSSTLFSASAASYRRLTAGGRANRLHGVCGGDRPPCVEHKAAIGTVSAFPENMG